MQFLREKFSLIALTLIIFQFWSCERPELEKSYIEGLFIEASEVGAEAGELPVSFSTLKDWKLSVAYTNGEGGWLSLDSVQGLSGEGAVTLSFTQNTSGAPRSARILLKAGPTVRAWDFTQTSHPVPELPEGINEDPAMRWMELPAVSKADGLYLFTHNHMVKGKIDRDWSFYWDKDNLISRWVAYPLNTKLIGHGYRTDKWGGLDPHLSRDLQPVLADYYARGDRPEYRGSIHRGHQIPSADRLNRRENERTFYGTNMTPQNGDLNTGEWARLEQQVRDWSVKFDTLYVVTGCTMDESYDYELDNDGKKVTIPSGYFKALLGYSINRKASPLCKKTGGYTAAAFYFDNERDASAICLSIDELEDMLGMDFFVNLLAEIGPEKYEKVESAKDYFWNYN